MQASKVYLSFKTKLMILNGQIVGRLTLHQMISYCRLADYLSFKTTVGGIEWSDSRRVDRVLQVAGWHSL